MYHPSKRRKVERSVDQPAGKYGLHHRRERARDLGESKNEIPVVPNIVLPPNEDQESSGPRSAHQVVESLRQPSEIEEGSSKTLEPGQVVPASPKHVLKPRQAVTTMVAVDISNGQEITSQVIEPVKPNSNSVSVPGYGEVNITDSSTPTPSATNTNFVPGSVVPPAAIQASIARSQALATQEAIANELDAIPQSTAASITPENRAAAATSQSPTGATSLGSSLQQVLSSPSTPLPSTPVFSTGSYSSYFPSNAGPSPTSSPSITSATPNLTGTNSTMPGKLDWVSIQGKCTDKVNSYRLDVFKCYNIFKSRQP